jgi:hypothetical protein
MSLDVSSILTKLAEGRQKNFVYRGETLTLEQVFALSGTLSLFVRRANQLSDFLFGSQLNVSLVPDADSLTGERVVINEQQHSFVLIMLLYDVLEEMIINSGGGDVNLS